MAGQFSIGDHLNVGSKTLESVLAGWRLKRIKEVKTDDKSN